MYKYIIIYSGDLRDENGLVLAPDHHALESSLGDGEDVGRHLVPPFTDVDLHRPLSVDGEPLKIYHL